MASKARHRVRRSGIAGERLLDPDAAPARARRPRDLRPARQAREAARGQGRRARHAGRSQGRRLRRARGARNRAVPRPAQGDDPRRDERLPRPASTPARTACWCRSPDASSQQVLRERRRGAAALKDGRRRLGAHEDARVGEARRRSPTGWWSCTPSARSRAVMRSGRTRRGRPSWRSRFRTSPRRIKPRRSTTRSATWRRRKPMDRLVCGDVGYGKTEVAVRAIFKAIADRKQVAVLCPTTLLAAQHYRTFSARFASFPIRIEELSRFKTKKEAQAILERPRAGQGRRRGRHAPHLAEGRRVPRPRPDRGRRGAALRRDAQGAPQAAQGDGRRADAVRDADPAHAADVADGRARSLADPDGAEKPHVDQDGRRPGVGRGGAAGDRQRARPRRPSLLRAQPDRVDLRRRARARAARPQGAHRGGPRADARARARAGDEPLHRRRARRVRVDDDHRERHRHPQRQHDRRQRRRQVWSRATLSVTRPGRPFEPSSVRVFVVPSAQGAQRGREGAARGHPRVHPSRQRPADRDARPGDPRCGQPAGRGAVGLHRRGRLRDVRAAAGGGDRRAQRRPATFRRRTTRARPSST